MSDYAAELAARFSCPPEFWEGGSLYTHLLAAIREALAKAEFIAKLEFQKCDEAAEPSVRRVWDAIRALGAKS